MKARYKFLNRYAMGTTLYPQVGNLASNIVEGQTPDKTLGNQTYQGNGELIGGEALKYAGMGAGLGTALAPITGGLSIPIGAALGAIYGGVSGGIQSNKQKNAAIEANQLDIDRNLQLGKNNYQSNLIQGFNPNGNIYQSKLSFKRGGRVRYNKGGGIDPLKPLSKDSTTVIKPIVNSSQYPNTADPDSLLENLVEFVDPIGIFSWDDFNRVYSNPKSTTTDKANAALSVIPFVGKLGKVQKSFKRLQQIADGKEIYDMFKYGGGIRRYAIGGTLETDSLDNITGNTNPTTTTKKKVTPITNNTNLNSNASYKPIYVDNANDPRLRAYNDSNFLYKRGIEDKQYYDNLIKEAKQNNEVDLIYDPVDTKKLKNSYGLSVTNDFKPTNNLPIAAMSLNQRPKNGALWEDNKNSNYLHLDDNGNEVGGTNNPVDFFEYRLFAKPKQPYIRAVSESFDEPISKPIVKPVFKPNPQIINKQKELVKAGLLKENQVDGIWGKGSENAWNTYKTPVNTPIPYSKEAIAKWHKDNNHPLPKGNVEDESNIISFTPYKNADGTGGYNYQRKPKETVSTTPIVNTPQSTPTITQPQQGKSYNPNYYQDYHQRLVDERNAMLAAHKEARKTNPNLSFQDFSKTYKVPSTLPQYGKPIPKLARGGYLSRYAQGTQNPDAQYEVEKNEIVEGDNVNLSNGKQLSSTMHKAEDYTHEQYNPTTGTNGVVGQGGDKVYSDRSKLMNETIDLLKTFKLNIKKSDTHAKVAEIIAKKEKKFEEGLESTHKIDKTTSELMLNRLSLVKQLVFADQEGQKKIV